MENKEYDRNDMASEIAATIKTQDQDGIHDKYDAETVLEILDAFGTLLAHALANHSRVEIHELGVFRLEHRPSRKGIDPNGNAWETPDRLQVDFSAAPAMCRILADRLDMQVY